MKVAIVSDLYPPSFIGGYEIGMSWIADELRRRGAAVDVFHCREFFQINGDLTVRCYAHPRRGFANFDIGPGLIGGTRAFVRRKPWGALWLLSLAMRSQRNLSRFRKRIKHGRYDLILMGNPLGILTPIYQAASEIAAETDGRVGLLVSDNWVSIWPAALTFWSIYRPVAPPPWSAIRLRSVRARSIALRSEALRRLEKRGYVSHDGVESWLLDFVVCVSAYVASVTSPRISAPAKVSVAHWGLPLKSIPLTNPPDFGGETLNIVYVGQIEPHKGLQVVIGALAKAKGSFRLTVIGDDTTAYAAASKALVEALGLQSRVHFTGRLPQAAVYEKLAGSHVLVVPSMWEEPFAIVPLQGKLCGLVTVVSRTGGSTEGIQDGVDGLLFDRGDEQGLAEILDRLNDDRGLCRRLSGNAREAMLTGGDISVMVDKILEAAGVDAHRNPV